MPAARSGAEPDPRSGEVFVVRRTRAQRLAGAAGWLVAAVPLLVALPLLAPEDRVVVLITVVVAGVLLAGFDLVAQRDVRVEVHDRGLVTHGRLVPWWAIDAIDERTLLGVHTVEMTAFDIRFRLAVPRTGPIVPNPGYAADLRLLQAALETSRRGLAPVLDRPGRDRPVLDPPVIDLTDPTTASGPDPVEPVEPAAVTEQSAPRWVAR